MRLWLDGQWGCACRQSPCQSAGLITSAITWIAIRWTFSVNSVHHPANRSMHVYCARAQADPAALQAVLEPSLASMERKGTRLLGVTGADSCLFTCDPAFGCLLATFSSCNGVLLGRGGMDTVPAGLIFFSPRTVPLSTDPETVEG